MTELSKTVDQAMLILADLRRSGPGTPTEIARRLDTGRTATSRLLRTLEKHGQVRRTDGRFSLGFGLIDLASAVATDLRDAVRPALLWVSRELGETAVAAVRDGFETVAVDQLLPEDRLVQVTYRAGSRHALHEAAHGRAILAWCPPDVTESVVFTSSDPARLIAELAQIRQLGFAASRGELEDGVVGVAAPVFSPTGGVVASIGVVAPSNRLIDTIEASKVVVRAAKSVGREPALSRAI
jgi:DNA-binding IclR family transcriptional regulator